MQKINQIFLKLGGNLHQVATNVNKFLSIGNNRKIFLSGLNDGDFFDDKTIVKSVSVPALKLKASQNAVYINTVLQALMSFVSLRDAILKKNVEAPDMFISSDFYIIDGHHRWATTYALRPTSKINCTMINLPIRVALPIINAILISYKKFKSASTEGISIWDGITTQIIHEKFLEILDIKAEPKNLFIRNNDSIFISNSGKSLDEFYKLIYPKNFKLAPHFVFNNLNQVPQPSNIFGSRKQMPQIKEPDFLKKVISSGITDIADPSFNYE